ncbi:PREDICTED: probable G-protein coupled receptor 25 [Thamnophis sirtalis]|uniref:Probable G-protein coupled receptor 25 n=1 Tax=Thamnophis sirtalis TaxID=35019 RepID=A0A6I9YE37_9SAUR|nr:PREDICTED: probable G-protein coupled receptor 25 [Thamnophis sirtalis]
MKISELVTDLAMTKNWSRDLESSTVDFFDLGFTNDDFCFMEKLPFASVFISVIYFMIFFIGFFGNLFVILVIVLKRGNQRLVDNFILNLAIADLIFVCTLPFWAVTEAFDSWQFGEEFCKISSYAIFVNRCSSILFLMGMSVERFLVMNKHWDSRFLGTKRNTSITCSCIWVFSFLLGIPSLLYRKLIPVGDRFACQDEGSSIIYTFTVLCLTFLLPLGVILFCYCSIFTMLQSHVNVGRKTNHALKIIFVIIGAFICCWLPFNTFTAVITYGVVQNIDFSCEAWKVLRWGVIISACLAFTNSCINPIIYAFMDQQFRQKVLKSVLGRLCPAKENVQSSTLFFSSTESSVLFGSKKRFIPATIVPVSSGADLHASKRQI